MPSGPSLEHRVLVMLQNLDWCLGLACSENSFQPDVDYRARADLLDDWVDLQAVLAGMSARDRQFLLLLGLYHLSEREVATRLHISQPGVHKRWDRLVAMVTHRMGRPAG